MSLLWLRSETKRSEKRTPLAPQHVISLIEEGHQVVVESSRERIFLDTEYIKAGCQLVKSGSWKTAPNHAIILGLKDLPNQNFPLTHRHIYFAHAYNQNRIFHEKPGVAYLMQRFKNGGGSHYDLEFLINERGERVAAFGSSAGLAGALIALLIWPQKQMGFIPPFTIPLFFKNLNDAINSTRKSFITSHNNAPKILIIGSNGRCGTGVKALLRQFNLSWDEWGREETRYKEKLADILNYDILFNCAYVAESVIPFLTTDQLEQNRALKLIVDVSCETSSNNPLQIYTGTTTYDNPTHRIYSSNQPIDIIAIDNLPSFIPYESSLNFSTQLLPYLKQLLGNENGHVWDIANQYFKNHIKNIN